MSKKLLTTPITFDGEKHIRGGLCWCAPKLEEDTNTYIHALKFDKGSNVKTVKDFTA